MQLFENYNITKTSPWQQGQQYQAFNTFSLGVLHFHLQVFSCIGTRKYAIFFIDEEE